MENKDMYKVCSKCKREAHGKEEIELTFHKSARIKDGFDIYCKPCRRAYSKQYRDKMKEIDPHFLERQREYHKRWRKENQEKVQAWAKRWREENRDKIRRWAREYYHKKQKENSSHAE